MGGNAGASAEKRAFTWSRVAELAGAIAAWAWFIIAGCGGLGLIITTGPWPPTHGWFAMFSGIAACPLTAWVSRKYLRVSLSGLIRLGAAALFILAALLLCRFGMNVHFGDFGETRGGSGIRGSSVISWTRATGSSGLSVQCIVT